MKAHLIAALVISILTGVALQAQSPAPIIVQAVTPQTATVAKAAPVPVAPAATDATLKLLQDIKAANAAVLSKQAETLQQLDDLEKAAEQIRIFSKRG
ncbi:MAG: hypothetical protein ACXWBM_03545 [Chthoniobacterales bacterium]